jgi:hypothetical protein
MAVTGLAASRQEDKPRHKCNLSQTFLQHDLGDYFSLFQEQQHNGCSEDTSVIHPQVAIDVSSVVEDKTVTIFSLALSMISRFLVGAK